MKLIRGILSLILLPAGPVLVLGAGLPTFTDVTDAAGLQFKHSLGDFELSNIVEGTGPGGSFLDYDNDGLLDLYLVNGCWHPDVSDNRGRTLQGKLSDALYRNKGDGTFVDVTAQAGLQEKGYTMAAVPGDYDGDGDCDIYVCNYGPNVLYRNNGDGTFTDVTSSAGLGDPAWSVHASWFDYDKDNDLDLYVANYLTYDKGAFQRSGAYYKAENYPGPLAYPGSQDHLYRNDGGGKFTDVTAQAGLTNPNGRGMSAVTVDIDRDGDIDIYVPNDAMPNNLWINDGKGHFVDKALEYGVAFGEGGQGASSMGPFVGDVDRNGLLDVLVPDMGYGCLLFQMAPNLFLDVTAQSGMAMICGQYTGWGGLLFDFDNDGFLDVFIANGDPHHLYPEEAVLARYVGEGKLKDVAKQCGDFFHTKQVSRGAACGDYDNDGDLDVLVLNLNDRPRLLRNDGANKQGWLKVAPLAKGTKQIALNSFVTVKSGNRTMVQPVIASNGYLAASDPRAHFGLDQAAVADSVEVEWPDGAKQKLTNVKAGQILSLPYPQTGSTP